MRRPALHTLDETLGRWIAAWLDAVLRRPRSVVALGVASSALLLALALPQLRVTSDDDALFAPGAHFKAARSAFAEAFPSLIDPVVVVVEADTVEGAREAAHVLTARLRRDPRHFPFVFEPGGGRFFERDGLLYLESDELADLVDRLAEVQPFLATLARDPSLRGLFTLLADAAEAARAGELGDLDLEPVFDRVAGTIRARLAGESRPLSWGELLLGHAPTRTDLRRIVLVKPRVDYTRIDAAGAALGALRGAIGELGLDRTPGVRVRFTGALPLSSEESSHVTSQSRLAGLASFLLVSGILAAGLRSLRLVLCTLATLLVALAWTAAFAGLAVGSLNIISVAFAVLCIGLSVDYGVHLVIHYREQLGPFREASKALREAARGVGGSLAVCAVTTAAGFYAFVPTDFRGIAQLGLIAGTGIFLSLLANLTFLPALLSLAGENRPPPLRPPPRWLGRALDLPVRHARLVVAGTVAAALAAAALLPEVRFDLNPLRVRDPSTEAVETYEDLLADGMAFPWNLDAVAEDREAARRLATRLEALPTVDHAVTLDDWIPDQQEEKLALLEDASYLLGPALDPERVEAPPDEAARIAALEGLERRLAELRPGDGAVPAAAAERLRRALGELRASLPDAPDARAAVLDALHGDLLATLPEQLRLLRSGLQAEPVTVEELPAELRRQLITPDGRVRVEIFPRGDLNDNAVLERYVASVTAIAPDAFGDGLVISESGHIVVRAFREALILAAAGIALLLLLLWRNALDAALVALPLALASLLTAAATVVLGMPFNFANVIVIPLLLGMGVDTGIHLVHRLRYAPPAGGNLLRTATTRAVLLSALTTIASFGTLGFSTHLGMASLGRLLVLGIALILACNLLFLPALVALGRRRAEAEASGGKA